MHPRVLLYAMLASLVASCRNDASLDGGASPADSLKGRFTLVGTSMGDTNAAVSIEGSGARERVAADGSWSLPIPEGVDRSALVVRYEQADPSHTLLFRDSAPVEVDGRVRGYRDPSVETPYTATFFVDPRDGESYRLVVLGGRTWMAQNLRYRAGGSVPAPGLGVEYAWLAGRLYTWSAAMGLPSRCDEASCEESLAAVHRGICPTGWHVPGKAEWDDATAGARSMDSVAALRGLGGWAPYNRLVQRINADCFGYQIDNGTCPAMPPELVSIYPSGSNRIGFDALPNRTVATPGVEALWWQPLDSAERSARAVRSNPSADEGLVDVWTDKVEMAGIRCVRD